MFEVGQKVLCISKQPSHTLVVGGIYEISRLWPHEAWMDAHCSETVGVDLVGVPRPPSNYCFCGCRFRPIDDPSIEIFRQMVKELV